MGKHLMNMGDGTGIPWQMGLDLDGRFACLLKDFLDRRVMPLPFQEVPGEVRCQLDCIME